MKTLYNLQPLRSHIVIVVDDTDVDLTPCSYRKIFHSRSHPSHADTRITVSKRRVGLHIWKAGRWELNPLEGEGRSGRITMARSSKGKKRRNHGVDSRSFFIHVLHEGHVSQVKLAWPVYASSL